MYSNDQWQNSTGCHFSLGEVELEVMFLQNYHAKHLLMAMGLSFINDNYNKIWGSLNFFYNQNTRSSKSFLPERTKKIGAHIMACL